jgi:8-oxo-dGTP diphosphatase
MSPEIAEIYGNRVRIRVCGLCWQEQSLLLIKHRMGSGEFWAPPGGGVEFNEPLEGTLKREFLEETGLDVIPEKFLFGCEFIKAPLHAIELFFQVRIVGGILKNGYDPEMQLIDKAQFLSQQEIQGIQKESMHGIINRFQTPEALRQLNGFYRI